MNGLFFLLCCTEILGALLCGAQQFSTDHQGDSNNLTLTTTSDTAPTSFTNSTTEASTASISTRSTTKVTSKSPCPSPTPVTQSTLFNSFLKPDCRPLLMVTGGLMIVCTILLVSTLLLACKVCHLSRHIRGLSSNSDLISNTEYWVGTGKKGKSKTEAEPKETTVLMADINETPAETGNGTKEEGGKVTEEGQMGGENKKEVEDAANGKEASTEPVAEKSSLSKSQEDATDSQTTKAATASTSEGTEEPKVVA